MRLVLDARTAAFAALIDYAGLFPPASESMQQAVDRYRTARSGPSGWVSGRFLCRASDLTELASVVTKTFRQGDVPWEIGVIFDLPAGEAASLASDFHREMDPAVAVSAAEARLPDATQEAAGALVTTMLSITPDIVPFIEIDRSENISKQIKLVADVLASRRRTGGAKLRCGGLTPDLFPEPAEVAEFIISACNDRLAFKATAGLHQPVRHFDETIGTYRHGFVNIAMATAFAEAGSNVTKLEAVIEETDMDAFTFNAASASWRDETVPGTALRRMRQTRFVAYGSCDFDEPVDALADLGFLGVGT